MKTTQDQTNEQLAIRKRGAVTPNHHIWNNNGIWWVHYTLHHGWIKQRVRSSLATRCVEEARRKRDALFQALNPTVRVAA